MTRTPIRVRARAVAGAGRTSARDLKERAIAGAGGAAGRFGRGVVLRVHRDEVIPLPPPLTIDGITFDILSDLEQYTGLPRELVESLVKRRIDSFRAEWFLTPPKLRVDDWFYLASTTYLFANAVHLHDEPHLLGFLEDSCGRTGLALEFGGGTGNLALALAARGWSVDYLERSALQKDFVRFRIARYGLGERVQVLDDWEPLAQSRYGLVCALDVLEHVPDLQETLGHRLLPSIRSGGALAESSPFVRNLSNPMHHEEADLDQLLRAGDLNLEVETAACRIWRKSSATRDD